MLALGVCYREGVILTQIAHQAVRGELVEPQAL